jgi:hypothetical protein
MLMITTSTSSINANHLQKNTENLSAEFFEDFDAAFYESVKTELDALVRNPQDETIARILAYSRAK